jgi:tripartite-type tricarboxylate transporter receptor subunit TctC
MTLRVLILAVLSLFAVPASAQDYPARPITLVVPFAAGGPSDIIGRLLAQSMSQTLKQQVIVENTAGAGGTLAIGRVAKAAPDGYTILISHVNHAATAILYRKLQYDAVEDFAHIGLVTDGAMVLLAKNGLKPNTIAELAEYIRENKDKVSYAHAGIGSGAHLCGLQLMSALQTQLTVVTYRGTGPALVDLVGGQIDMLCDQVTSALPQIQAKTVKAFAVTTKEPLPSLPLPSMEQAGFKGFEVNVWHGLYAPKGTPAPIVERLAGALRIALKDPLILKRLEELSTTPVSDERATPAALKAHLIAEIAKWRPIIQGAGQFAD